MIKRLTLFALAFALGVSAALGTTVTGTLLDATGAPIPNGSVTLQLENYGAGNIPRIINTGTLVSTQPVTLTANAQGQISGTAQGDDTITPASTYYLVTFYAGSSVYASCDYLITGSTFNLTTASCLATPPAIPPSIAYTTVEQSSSALQQRQILNFLGPGVSCADDPAFSTTDCTITSGNGTGTVTSVGLSLPSLFSVTGSPVTASGTLTASLASQTQNLVFASPNGASGAPAFRALTLSDLPGINFTNIAGTASDAQLAGAYSGAGACAANEFAITLTRNAAPTCAAALTAFTAPSHLWISAVSAAGVFTASQPAFADLSGDISISQVPTLNQSTTGNAATATALAATPAQCTSGQYATGIAANGNANCGTPSGAGTVTSVGIAGTANEISVSGTSPITSSGTLTLSITNNPTLPGTTTGTFSGPLTGNVTGNVSGTAATITGALSVANTPLTTSQDILFDNAGALGRLPITTVTNGQCLGNNGGAWGSFACSGGSGLPATWSVGAGNFVNAAPTAATDTTTLSIVPSLAIGGTFNIAQIGNASLNSAQVGCTANVYWAITFNGNMCFSASNLQLSTSTGAAPYFYLNGMNSYPGQPYIKTDTAELGVPTLAVSNSTTGGTVAAGTYYFKITYVNLAGETPGSTEAPTTTTGSTSTITVTAPGAQYSAFGYQIYEASTSGSEKILVPTSSNCTLATQTFGGNAVCAASANATFTSIPTAGSLTPPTTNTTGGAYIAAFAPAADGLGMFLTNNAPGADAPLDSGLVLPGGTGVNLTSGATTTANALACLSGSNTVSQCAANAANTIIGVFASSGQNSLVQTTGIATVNLAASATTTANDFACSNATAGTVVDNGTTACAAGQQVGIIAQTNGTAVSSVPVMLRFAGSGGSSNTFQVNGTNLTSSATINWLSGGPITVTNTSAGNVQFTCPSCLVNNPAATQTITPGSASVEGLAIVSNGGTSTDAFDVSQNGWNSIKVNGYGQVYLSHSPSVDTLNIDSSQAGTALNFESAKDHITSSVANNDISGQIAVSSATSASYTFARAYGSAPNCVLTPTSNPGSLTWWVTASTTAVTANLSASGTLTFNYHCNGAPN